MLALKGFVDKKVATRPERLVMLASTAPKPKGRIMVKDRIVWINIMPQDGVPRRIPAWPGESLLESIKRYRVPGIPADCNGGDPELKPWQVPYDYYSAGVYCSTCMVAIPDPWFEKIPMTSVETNQIERSDMPISSHHRLSCCIQVRDWMNEMPVTIAGNRAQEGEFGHIYMDDDVTPVK